MAEMKSSLEEKLATQKERLDEANAEKEKHQADATQWKAMAQKELRTRLALETEKAALQREMDELKRQSQVLRER